ATRANVLGSIGAPPPPASGAQAKQPVLNDGFDRLLPGQGGLSYSTLTHMGRVHPPAYNPGANRSDPSWHNPLAPLLTIVWGTAMQTGASAGEPATGINPSNILD